MHILNSPVTVHDAFAATQTSNRPLWAQDHPLLNNLPCAYRQLVTNHCAHPEIARKPPFSAASILGQQRLMGSIMRFILLDMPLN
jgi:hypothetical protein